MSDDIRKITFDNGDGLFVSPAASDDNSDWLEALEITDRNGAKTGKFQLILRNEQHDVFSLCNHEHDTAEEALACPEGRHLPWDHGITIADCITLAATINPATVTVRNLDGHSATRIVVDEPQAEQMQ